MPKTSWIGVDFDGTLAYYDHWRGASHTGAPITKMVDRVKRWLNRGEEVRIFTARVAPDQTDEDIDKAERAITTFCLTHIGQELPITCIKDTGMIELWDDRCVQVKPNTGELVVAHDH